MAPKTAIEDHPMKNVAKPKEDEADCCGKPRRGRPLQMDPSERETAILMVTAQLLMTVPFDEVTMAVIACRAGMSKRTVYLHFKNREELMVRAIEDISRTVFRPLNTEDAQRPLRERLSLLLRVNEPPGSDASKLEVLRSIIAKAQTYPVLAQQLHANGRGAVVGFVRAEISRAVDSGEIALVPSDLEMAAETLLDMACENILTRLLHPGLTLLDAAKVERRREFAITVFLHGCSP